LIEIRITDEFSDWLLDLRDRQARARIAARIQRLAFGHFGDARSVGDGVEELRFHFGPGYRVYFIRQADFVVVLLCGGDKDTQERDIVRAKILAKEEMSP
jgi:putative addiction module killer protein